MKAGFVCPADLDGAWLKERVPDADEGEVEAFVERVGIAMAVGGQPEDAARAMAHVLLLERRANLAGGG